MRLVAAGQLHLFMPLLCMQALGIKPKTIRAPKQLSLDPRDMAQLMQRGEDEEGEDPARQVERIKGLGYKMCALALQTSSG